MSKPKDYNTYFNADGSPKENPFLDSKGNILAKSHKDAIRWASRQEDIYISLLSNEERAEYQAAMRNLEAKMSS